MSAITPGPWESDGQYVYARAESYVAKCHKRPAMNANARAISALPDLIEALRRWQSYGCPDCGGDCGSANPPVNCCIMQETRAALTKAGVLS